MIEFDDAGALKRLHSAGQEAIDGLDFGVVGLEPSGLVARYNRSEAEAAALDPEAVVGKHFFDEVAPCLNNYLVRERFEQELELDETIPYVLTFRMKPTKVMLRLLRSADIKHMYLLVRREG